MQGSFLPAKRMNGTAQEQKKNAKVLVQFIWKIAAAKQINAGIMNRKREQNGLSHFTWEIAAEKQIDVTLTKK